MKKAVLILIVTVITVGAFIYLYLKPTSYMVNYEIEDYDIKEEYDKETKVYYFSIEDEKNIFEAVVERKYDTKRKLVTEIETFEKGDTKCIKTNLTIPLCKNKEDYVSVHLVSEELKQEMNIDDVDNNEVINTYENTEIYSTKDNYAVWNYKGFDLIKGKETKQIELFKKDIYDVSLITQINEFLVIPDYESDYYFDKLYILNLETEEVEEWKLDYEISFFSYVLGINDKSIYLVDRKNKKEYEIVPHKKKMRVVGNEKSDGTILREGEWIDIGMNKLASDIHSFKTPSVYNYFIEEELLHLNYSFGKYNTIVSDKKVSKIVSVKGSKVYFLVEDDLYSYDLTNYETLCLTNSEWNFNSNNVIFVY